MILSHPNTLQMKQKPNWVIEIEITSKNKREEVTMKISETVLVLRKMTCTCIIYIIHEPDFMSIIQSFQIILLLLNSLKSMWQSNYHTKKCTSTRLFNLFSRYSIFIVIKTILFSVVKLIDWCDFKLLLTNSWK